MISTLRGGVIEDPPLDLSRTVTPEFVEFITIFILVGLLRIYLKFIEKSIYVDELALAGESGWETSCHNRELGLAA